MKQISFQHDVLPMKNRLFRLALRILLNREEAEDIVQETLINLWNNRQQWQNIDSIEAYAMTICRNTALDAVRKQSRRRVDNDAVIDERQVDKSPNPHEQVQHSDMMSVVNQIINALPEKQRSCIQLRDIEGKTYKEIAQVMGISEEQVKVSIYRARQTLKEKLTTTNKYGL